MNLFSSRFTVQRRLGEGSYGMAFLATENSTQKDVALKVIMKDSLKKVSHYNRLRREINILRLLDHPHIIKLYEVLEMDTMIVLVTEYASGGDLYTLVTAKQRLCEAEARKYFRQIASALAYLHGNNLAHRDLKPENILIDENGDIKLIDFGFVREIMKGTLLKTYCGSYNYCAPEMLQGQPYEGLPSDIWSLGVVLFVMLNGYFPFSSDNMQVLLRRILNVEMETNDFASIESLAFIQCMIVRDPAHRLTIDQVCESSWCMEGYSMSPKVEFPGSYDKLILKEAALEKLAELEYISQGLDQVKELPLVVELPEGELSRTAGNSDSTVFKDANPLDLSFNQKALLSNNEFMSSKGYTSQPPRPLTAVPEDKMYASEPNGSNGIKRYSKFLGIFTMKKK